MCGGSVGVGFGYDYYICFILFGSFVGSFSDVVGFCGYVMFD